MKLYTFNRSILLLAIFSLISTVSFAQLLTYDLSNEAATGCANHMNGGYYAFDTFSWDGTSSAIAAAENMTSVSGTANLSYASTTFTLKYYKHINVVNSNGDPTTSGERGDYRIYSDGTITLTDNSVIKLVLTNCISVAKVSWPALLDGPGDNVVGHGWGVIDVGSSDASWVSEFDANGTGQVYIEYSSVSNVLQATCGSTARYDFTVNFYPSSFSREILSRNITVAASPIKGGQNSTMATAVDMSEINLAFNFSAATNGGSGSDKNDLYAEFRTDTPGGSNPATINAIGSDGFWDIGTTLGSFTTSVTFDLSSYGGISDINDIRMLRRATEDADWEVYASQSVVGNTIVCTSVDAFSQWVPGSVGGDALPVELTAFSANVNDNSVTLNWTTATEVNNYGFEVQRASAKLGSNTELSRSAEGWQTIGFIEGHGNSNSQKDYSFIDQSVAERSRSYRLKQIDVDGSFEYSDIITVEVSTPMEFKLAQNHPNPFNPTTRIDFSIPNTMTVSIKVYNSLGEEIAELANRSFSSGNHSVEFNGSNLSSGMYFYTLQADGFSKTMKMMLLK